MPSTPKNPLDGGGSIQGEPNKTIPPRVPPYDGGQFARDFATPDEIDITRDKAWNEIPTDRPYHIDTTPGHSNQLYVGRQFDTQVDGPTATYGVATQDRGQSPSRETVKVDGNNAERGKDQ